MYRFIVRAEMLIEAKTQYAALAEVQDVLNKAKAEISMLSAELASSTNPANNKPVKSPEEFNTFIGWLNDAQNQRKITDKELGAIAGGTVSNWRKGHIPKTTTLGKLADWGGVPIGELIALAERTPKKAATGVQPNAGE